MPSKQSSMQPYMPPRRFTAAYLRVGEEAPRTAEEKKRRHQDLNIIYGRKDGLMKKMFELWEKSNKIAKTPVQFSMKFLGRWYIFNSEHGQTRNSWFPTEEEVVSLDAGRGLFCVSTNCMCQGRDLHED